MSAQSISQRYGIQPHYPDPFSRLISITKTQTDLQLTKRERQCLASMLYFSGYTNVCAGVRRESLADRMGCSVSTVYRTVKSLEAKGFITVERKSFTRNVYTLIFMGA
jgi:DNA-binding MarR family transcriptional regulator